MTVADSFLKRLAIAKEISIFEDLSFMTLNQIARMGELVEFNKGDMIAIGAVAGGGAYGTARTRIAISKEYPAAAV